MKKTYAVIGLGKFGTYMARGLATQGENLIVCDNSRENFRDLQNDIEDLYVLDSTDKVALAEAGISELDVVIVSIGENIEASILTVMALRELGNKTIIAKAVSQTHGQILLKIGSDKIIYPEKEAANRLLSELVSQKADVELISEDLKLCKMIAGELFGKKTIASIESKTPELSNPQSKESLKVIAIKSAEKWQLDIDPNYEVLNEDFLVLIGSSGVIDFCAKM
ncbi:hypothetical protein BKH46_06835 [Helicobacter sp. 12S02634-8]|uniref:potassium channel family protein n=1 Tax=Helicobacter sp. 12S02634-8 TaxID=1476199 RepID=UPI000BA54DAE|nr:TrkA family potassium uptake protein [Helicobacter sp. 12S02634-8]PAF46678.1 hypothetical protein BKH46_06835 [Helicobacter sp. 12S02634-8]